MNNSMKLVLGSKSPRRKELLSQLGFDFTVKVADCDETFPESLNAGQIPIHISHLKADAIEPLLQANEILLCSDTIVYLNGQVLGKPTSREEAFQMLSNLSGQTHEVITGILLKGKTINESRSVVTKVTFKDLTEEEINYYIDNYHPFDKAGSYGIQEWIGQIGVVQIEGSYTNVVGLPTSEVYKLLSKYLK